MGTYNRTPADRTRRVQCPCCLKAHKAKKGGRVTRHGWKETGRIVGSYGNGWQWGNCSGWGQRPLEETDADALDVIEQIQADIDKATAELDEHVDGWDSYTYTTTRQLYSFRAALDARLTEVLEGLDDLDVEITEARIRKQGHCVYYRDGLQYVVSVPRGHGGITLTARDLLGDAGYRHGSGPILSVPSWDDLRQRYIAALRKHIAAAKAQQAAIREAIEHHRANPSPWHVASLVEAK